MADPIFLAVKHVCKIKSLAIDAVDIEEFFSKGYFYDFVSVTFDNVKIPFTKKSNRSFQIAENNKRSVMFLIEQSTDFARMNPNWNNKNSQKSILNALIKLYYYKKSFHELIDLCNMFIASYHFEIKSIADFSEGNAFVYLFNVYTNGEIKFNSLDDKYKFLDEAFQKTAISQIINKTAFLPEYQDVLKFQIEIMLDEFSKKKYCSILPSETKPAPKEENHSVPVTFAEGTVYNRQVISRAKSSDGFNSLNNTDYSDDYEDYDEESERINLSDQNKKTAYSANYLLSEDDTSMMNSSDDETSENESLFSTDSYVNIINHILGNDTVTFVDEINDGIIIPSLIEKVLNVKINGISEDPDFKQAKLNNKFAVNFLKKYDQMIGDKFFNFNSKCECEEFIKMFFKRVVFKKDVTDKMIEQINAVLNVKYNTNVKNLNKDWKNGYNLVALLDFLSNGEIKYTPPPTTIPIEQVEPIDLKMLMLDFEQSKCPIIIDNQTLSEVDEVSITFQIKVIFDEITKRGIEIPTLQSQKMEPTTENEQKQDENDFIFHYEKLGSDPIIRTVNAIALQIGLHFNTIDDLIDGELFPKFVKFIVGDVSIPGVKTDPNFLRDPSNKRENIKKVVEYLKGKNEYFNEIPMFLLNFDKIKRHMSIISVVKGLLNIFFVKTTKTRIIERCNIIFQYNKKITYLKKDFQYGAPFLCLIHFIRTGKLNYIYQTQKFCDMDLLISSFAEAKVPFILDENTLTDVVDDFIYYQLQFIFDRIDNTSTPAKIVQYLMKANSRIRQIQLPNKEKLDYLLKKKEEYKKNHPKKEVKFLDGNDNTVLKKLMKEEETKIADYKKSNKMLDLLLEKEKLKTKEILQKQEELKKKIEEEKRKMKEEKERGNKEILEEEERIRKEEEEERRMKEEGDKIRRMKEEEKVISQKGLSPDQNIDGIIRGSQKLSTVMNTFSKEYDNFITDIFSKASNKLSKTSLVINRCTKINRDQFDHPTDVPVRLFKYEKNNWVFIKENWKNFLQNNKGMTKMYTFLLVGTEFLTASKLCEKCSNSQMNDSNYRNSNFVDMYCCYSYKNLPICFLMFNLHVSMSYMEKIYIYRDILNKIQISLSLKMDLIISVIDKNFMFDQISMINDIYSKFEFFETKPKKMFLFMGKPQISEEIDEALVFEVNSQIQQSNFFQTQIEKIFDIKKITQKSIDISCIALKWIDIDDLVSYNVLISETVFMFKSGNPKESELIGNDLENSASCSCLMNNTFFDLIKEGNKNLIKNFFGDIYGAKVREIGKNEQEFYIEIFNSIFEDISKCFNKDSPILQTFCSAKTEYLKNRTGRYEKNLLENLEKESFVQRNQLKTKIKSNISFWSNENKILLVKSHDKFLEDKFFQIITSYNKLGNQNKEMIMHTYLNNIKILNNQKEEDKKYIDKLFIEIDLIEKKRNQEIFKNFDEASKRAMSYVMREKESTKEITVIVDKVENIKKEIPQDF